MSIRQLTDSEKIVIGILQSMYGMAVRKEKKLRERFQKYQELYPVQKKAKEETRFTATSAKSEKVTIFTLCGPQKSTGKRRRSDPEEFQKRRAGEWRRVF